MTSSRRVSVLLIALCLCLATAAGDARQQPAAFELDEWTVAQLQEAMASGRYTSRKLVDLYLARIEAIDRNGPALRSVIEVNPDATAIADALDRERAEKGARGPLHGIPVLIKDNIDTGDRMMTSAGSLALDGTPAPRDSFVAARLRAAGAVILGKTNLSEWANFRSTRSTSGWSARGGQVKLPYALDRNPCGSSSGTGSAIAANLAAVGIGTETDGSIVCPSATSSLVGIKPTVGLVSRSGIVPISHTQDTAGPMTRTVADAAVLLGALTGVDPADRATAASKGKGTTDYARALDATALKGSRIGVLRKRYTGYHPDTDKLFEAALAAMKAQGATLVDPADLPTADRLDGCEFEILLYEFKADLNAYFASRGDTARVRSLEDLIAFNERESAREMPFFGQEILLQAQKKGPLTSAAYRRALTSCRTRSRALGIDAVMKRHKLDALVAPTGGPAWPTDLVNGDHFVGSSSTPAAVAGYPNVTVPAGFVHDLPVGISFIGGAWSEARLIGLAYSYEQATRHRRPPTFLPTIPAGTSSPAQDVAMIEVEGEGTNYWPRWRGPSGQGYVKAGKYRDKWSATDGVAWKVPVPGRGHSSPVVWGDRIFLTTEYEGGAKLSMLAFRRADGKQLWETFVPADSVEHVYPKNSRASATAVTDGKLVFGSFGTHGLAAFDFNGKLAWHTPVGRLNNYHGSAGSPILYKNTVIIYQDHQGTESTGSFVAAFDKTTGKQLWKTPRKETTGWGTPIVIRAGNRDELIVSSQRRVYAYDPRNGKELWTVGGLTFEVIPTPVVAEGLVICSSGRQGPTVAIKPGGDGDVTATHVAWQSPKGSPFVPSGIVLDGVLYIVNDIQSVLTALDAKTGEVLYQGRLGVAKKEGFSASPVTLDGKVFFTNDDGETFVLKGGRTFQLLHVNELGEQTLASPALVDGRWYFRTASSLLAIQEAAGR